MEIKYIFFLMAGIGLASLMASCDNIDEADRFIPEEKPIPDPHAVPKTLLIQELTGIQCVNCPDGAQVIHGIQESYPGKVIAVGIHPEGGGSNTRPIGAFDLRSEASQTFWENSGKLTSFPCAFFNGTDHSTDKEYWNTLAMQALLEPAVMTIDAESTYDQDTRKATVDYTINLTADLEADLRVMVWVMENNIIGPQRTATATLRDYEHNHVLRASMNGNWGEGIGNRFDNGQKLNGTASMVIDEAWNPENCEVVVYVFRNSDNSVEQAVSIPLSE